MIGLTIAKNVRKVPEGRNFYNSEKNMKRRGLLKTSKDKKPVVSDVFERLFKSGAKEKAKLNTRVKENISKKAKDVQPVSLTSTMPKEKDISILRENKKMVNNSRAESTEQSFNFNCDFVSHFYH